MSPNNATDHISCILPLVNIMLTISPSTAECERGFSLMNGLKTQNRTSIKQDTLSCLMRIKVDGSDFESFLPAESLNNWLESGNRHIHGHKLSGPRGPRAANVQAASGSDSD